MTLTDFLASARRSRKHELFNWKKRTLSVPGKKDHRFNPFEQGIQLASFHIYVEESISCFPAVERFSFPPFHHGIRLQGLSAEVRCLHTRRQLSQKDQLLTECCVMVNENCYKNISLNSSTFPLCTRCTDG
jgi:hypothetical protein